MQPRIPVVELHGIRADDLDGEAHHALMQLGRIGASQRGFGSGCPRRAARDRHQGHGAHCRHLGPEESEAGAHLVIVEQLVAEALLRHGDQALDGNGKNELAGNACRAAFKAEGRHRDIPAVVQSSHDIGDRYSHVVVEDLVEVMVMRPRHDVDGTQLDPRRAHVADHPADALVLRCLGIRPHQQLLPVGDMRVARPDFRAVHDKMVPVDLGTAAQSRQIRPVVGLGEALAPDNLALQHLRQVERLLLLAAALDDGRCRMADRDEQEVVPVARIGIGAVQFLLPDELVDGREASPAIVFGPRHAGPATLILLALPCQRMLAIGRTVMLWRRRSLGRVRRKPLPRLLAKELIFLRVDQIHVRRWSLK